MAASLSTHDWSGWIDRVVEEARAARVKRRKLDRFQCYVAEQPALLVPRRLMQWEATESAQLAQPSHDLAVSANCVLCEPGQLPEELQLHSAPNASEWWDGFACDDAHTAWVKSPFGAWRPFWLDAALADDLGTWQAAGRIPSSLPALLERALVAARILTTAESEASAEAAWAESAREGRERFARDRFLPLADLVHPYHLGELRRYYRRLIRRGNLPLGDSQSPFRYIAHNEPVARFFHQQLTKVVSAMAGEELQPSYVYFASYTGGAELERHTDRAQCEVSLSLCLDYAPDPDEATPWPLMVDTAHGTVTVRQALGDALLYRGCELPHYRRRLAEGHTSTSWFLHYVPVGFQGSLR
jgi:hypothetical protein